MPSSEERMARSMQDIAGYAKQIVRQFELQNRKLDQVAYLFTKWLETSEPESQELTIHGDLNVGDLVAVVDPDSLGFGERGIIRKIREDGLYETHFDSGSGGALLRKSLKKIESVVKDANQMEIPALIDETKNQVSRPPSEMDTAGYMKPADWRWHLGLSERVGPHEHTMMQRNTFEEYEKSLAEAEARSFDDPNR